MTKLKPSKSRDLPSLCKWGRQLALFFSFASKAANVYAENGWIEKKKEIKENRENNKERRIVDYITPHKYLSVFCVQMFFFFGQKRMRPQFKDGQKTGQERRIFCEEKKKLPKKRE